MTYPGIENDPDSVAADPDRVAVEERRREREAEFSKYVAAQDIPWGSVHAYFSGEPVATTTAEKYNWLELGYVKLADQPESGSDSASGKEEAPAPTAAESVMAAAAKSSAAKKSGGSN